MKTEDVYELDKRELVQKLKEINVELTFEQELELREYYLRHDRTHLYAVRTAQKESSFIFRLTLPLFLIWNAMLYVAGFFKWLFTGSAYFSTKGIIYGFTTTWERKIGL